MTLEGPVAWLLGSEATVRSAASMLDPRSRAIVDAALAVRDGSDPSAALESLARDEDGLVRGWAAVQLALHRHGSADDASDSALLIGAAEGLLAVATQRGDALLALEARYARSVALVTRAARTAVDLDLALLDLGDVVDCVVGGAAAARGWERLARMETIAGAVSLRARAFFLRAGAPGAHAAADRGWAQLRNAERQAIGASLGAIELSEGTDRIELAAVPGDRLRARWHSIGRRPVDAECEVAADAVIAARESFMDRMWREHAGRATRHAALERAIATSHAAAVHCSKWSDWLCTARWQFSDGYEETWPRRLNGRHAIVVTPYGACDQIPWLALEALGWPPIEVADAALVPWWGAPPDASPSDRDDPEAYVSIHAHGELRGDDPLRSYVLTAGGEHVDLGTLLSVRPNRGRRCGAVLDFCEARDAGRTVRRGRIWSLALPFQLGFEQVVAPSIPVTDRVGAWMMRGRLERVISTRRLREALREEVAHWCRDDTDHSDLAERTADALASGERLALGDVATFAFLAGAKRWDALDEFLGPLSE